MSSFYDRTSNIEIPSGEGLDYLTYNPVYGSTASFASRANIYETQNGYFNMIPMSINNVDAKFSLRFDVNETGARRLVDFFERKEGYQEFTFADNSNFYQNLDVVCDKYALNHVNKQRYEVAAELSVNQCPSILNWSGGAFVNATVNNWASGISFQKYDIIYSGINTYKANNFYYCTEDHSSSSASIDGPTGTNSKWTQEFFFEPSIGMQNEVEIKVDKIEFKNSFIQRMKTRKNLSQINLTLNFEEIPTKKAKAIFHFLENKAGYRRFFLTPSSVYNKQKVFFCPSWDHTWKFENCHSINAVLIEDPLGIVPTGT